MENVFAPDTYEEAKKLAARAKRSDLSLEATVDSLAFARDAQRRLKVEYDADTKTIKAKLKPFDNDRRDLNRSLVECEEHFEKLLLKTLGEGRELPAETKNGVRLSVTLLPRLGIAQKLAEYSPYDARLDEQDCREMEPFFLPLAQCIDWEKVKAHIEAGNEVPSFAEHHKVVSLRTKLPDVIE